MMLWFLDCKNVVAIANTYTSLGLHSLVSFFSNQAFLPFTYDLAKHRGSVERLVSGLGVIAKGFRIIDALVRPHNFMFEALWGGPMVIGGVTSRGLGAVIQYEDKAQLDCQ